MSTNNFTVIGRLAKDPELTFAKTGTAMCRVTIPDQKAVRTDAGEWENKSDTMWITATVFKEAAEALSTAAVKGDEVIATGRLVQRNWTDKNGTERQSLELDFAKVAVVPRDKQAQRYSGSQQSTAGGDPWATSGAGSNSYDQPPF